MDEHNDWLRQGFTDGVFLLAGSLQPGLGGGVICHGTTIDELQARIDDDPFVREKVVSAEIVELNPGLADERLAFLVP